MDVWGLEGSSWALLYSFTTADLPCDLEIPDDRTWHVPVIPDSHYVTLSNQPSASAFLDLLNPRCINVPSQAPSLKEKAKATLPLQSGLCCIRRCTHSPGDKSCQLFWLESHGPEADQLFRGQRTFMMSLVMIWLPILEQYRSCVALSFWSRQISMQIFQSHKNGWEKKTK